MYNKNINIKVDYRIIREDGMDQDLIIPIENGLIDLNVSDFKIFDRIQFTHIYAILLRITNQNMTICIHLLKDIDIFSSFVNMDIDLAKKNMVISKNDNHTIINIESVN